MDRPASIRFLAGAALVAAVLLSSGCSDWGDEPADDPDDGGPVGPPPTTVSFATDIQPIFDASCAGCHGAGGNAGLDLRAGVSHGNLVGVSASESSLDLIAPGDPLASWLYLKLTGAQDVGSPMPPGSPLPQSQVELVRVWIEEGALDN